MASTHLRVAPVPSFFILFFFALASTSLPNANASSVPVVPYQMGKQLQHKYSGLTFEDSNPGCMSGIFHILYFHRWHKYNVKRMLTHKRHGAGRHPGGLKSSKIDQNIPNTIEAPESMDSEVDKLLIEEKMKETSPTNKKSGEAHIKSLIAEEMSKEDDHKCRTKTFHPKLRLLRTYSIHHLEPSDYGFFEDMRAKGDSRRIDPHYDKVRTSGVSKVVPVMLKPPETDACSKKSEVYGMMNSENELVHTQVDEWMQKIQNHPLLWDKPDKGLLKQKYMDARNLTREDSLPQTKEFLDVLDVFQVNKELFLKVIEDPDSSLENELQNVQNFNATRELTKSGSFPVAYLCRNNVSSSNLENNLKEIRSFTKQERQLQAGRSPTKLTKSGSFPLMADGNEQERLGTAEPCKDSGCSLGSSHALKNQGDYPTVTNRSKNIKQRIKHAIKDSGKEHHRISMDATLHKISYGQKLSKDGKNEISDHWKKPTTDTNFKDGPSSDERDNSLYSVGNKGGLHHMRRTASLNESLHRYSQLFESTFSTESKQHLPDRISLTTEEVRYPGGPAPKAFGRILSLPELTSFGSLQSEVDTSCLGTQTMIHVDRPADMGSDHQKLAGLPMYRENDFELEASVETVTQEISEEVSESIIQGDEVELMRNADDDGKVYKTSDNLDNQTMLENSSTFNYQQEVELATDACVYVKQIQPTPNSVLDSHPSEVFIKEETDLGLKPKRIDCNELDPSVNLSNWNGSTTEIENVKIVSKDFDYDLPNVQVDERDEADFNYVRDVLKLSGFSGNEKLRTWHLPEQPVDPSLFEEVECSRQETGGSNCDHQLLFDVVNEVLVDIYERSLTYWPGPLSTNINIRPMPIGFHVLEEVWTSIRWFLRYQPEPNLSLDNTASRDLAKADGWMNLQFESECAGLMLEEWIWDELLEEVIVELEVA